MQIPGFIKGAANRGNKAAQAFVQQYDNGDNTPYDPNAYAAIKAQFDDYNGELSDDFEVDMEEESMSPEEQRATDKIEEYGEKYKSTKDINKVKYIKDAYDKGGDEMNRVDSALESRLGADYQMKYEDMNAIPEDVLEDIYNDLYGKNNYPDSNDDRELYENDLDDDLESDIPSEKEIDSLRKQEEMKKLDKEFPESANLKPDEKSNQENKEDLINVPYYDGLKGKIVDRYKDAVLIEYEKDGITRKERFYDDEIRRANPKPKEAKKSEENKPEQKQISSKDKTNKMRELIKNNWKEAIGGFQSLDKLSDYQLELMYDKFEEMFKGK